MNWEIIGTVAGICTTFSFIPQLCKSYKTKSVKDFSYWYLTVLTIGVLLWFLYGLGIKSFSVITANALTLVFVLALIGMKVQYHKR